MLRKYLAIAVCLALVPALASADYASVNGLKMYYEVQGSGRPLVLLHGGVCTIEVCIDKIRTPFAKTRRTIAIEQQGHGLKITKADFFGYSMGGGIALRIAMRHADLVRKVVIIGTATSNEGLIPGLAENMKALKPDDIPQQFRDAYAKTAPDPEQWPTLVGKIKGLMLDAKDLRPEEIRSIQAPTMFMIGDADIVRPEHAVEIFRLLPHGQLAVLPGSDRFAPMQRSAWVISMMRAFLEKP